MIVAAGVFSPLEGAADDFSPGHRPQRACIIEPLLWHLFGFRFAIGVLQLEGRADYPDRRNFRFVLGYPIL